MRGHAEDLQCTSAPISLKLCFVGNKINSWPAIDKWVNSTLIYVSWDAVHSLSINAKEDLDYSKVYINLAINSPLLRGLGALTESLSLECPWAEWICWSRVEVHFKDLQFQTEITIMLCCGMSNFLGKCKENLQIKTNRKKQGRNWMTERGLEEANHLEW